MNPLEIEEDIRRLELMLYGGNPVRPDADFGRGEVGYFEGVKARSPDVSVSPASDKTNPQFVVERYLISKEGNMTVKGPEADHEGTG